MSHELHDALREQGLVPPGEDVHFTACSTWYRHRLNEVSGGMVDADDYEQIEHSLRRAECRIGELEDELRTLENRIEDLQCDRDDAEKSAAEFRRETLDLRTENTRLTEKLLKLESLSE